MRITDRQYILSERAHLMCPNMHFGILARVNADYDRERVDNAISALTRAHPFLRSAIAYDGERPYYHTDDKFAARAIHRAPGDDYLSDYKRAGEAAWDVFNSSLIRVYAYPLEAGTQMLFIAHHLLCDGRGLIELACEFADAYSGEAQPELIKERLISSITELPPGSELSGVSKMLVKYANKQWAREGKRVTYDEYSAFAERFARENEVEYSERTIDEAGVERIREVSKQYGVSVNDLLMARVYLAAPTRKIVVAADIRSKLKEYRPRAMGNYATAMGIQRSGKRMAEAELAKYVSERVRAHTKDARKLMLVLACYLGMTGELVDAAAISALGGFESKPGRFVGARMFGFEARSNISVTNLGAITHSRLSSAMFIPPASPSAKLTLGVITVNGVMNVCASSYPKLIARDKVAEIISKLL